MGLLDKISGLTVEGPMPSPRHRKSDPRRGKGVFYRVGVGFGPDGFSWEIHQDRIHLRKTNKKGNKPQVELLHFFHMAKSRWCF